MPKSIPLNASQRWTVVSYTVIAGDPDPTSGSVSLQVRVDMVHDGSVTTSTTIGHTFTGPKMRALVQDAGARVKAYLDAGQPPGPAYHFGTRDAMYAALQTEGIIPLTAV